MTRNATGIRRTWLATMVALPTFIAVFVIWRTASAGPPLICWPVEIGEGRSLPWGDGPFDEGSCDEDDVVRETLHLLRPDTDILVRMETIRRATISLNGEEEHAHELLACVMARVLDAEATGTHDALAWFDAAYLVQAYHQMYDFELNLGEARGVAGYGWMLRAIEVRGEDARMQFAAALMTAMSPGSEHEKHLELAVEQAGKDPLLQKNLKQFDDLFTQIRPHFSKKSN